MKKTIEKIIEILGDCPTKTCKRAALNMGMDFPSVKSKHKKSKLHGNNVSRKIEKLFLEKVEKSGVLKIKDVTGKELLNELTSQAFYLQSRKDPHPHYTHPENSTNCFKPVKGKYARFIPILTFYKAFIRRKNDLVNGKMFFDKKKVVRAYGMFLKNQNSGKIKAKQYQGWLGKPRNIEEAKGLPKPIWVTNYSKIKKFIDNKEKNMENLINIIRLASLPGYKSEIDRNKAIGIVCLVAKQGFFSELAKPTILDAFDCEFFFCGPYKRQTSIWINRYVKQGLQ